MPRSCPSGLIVPNGLTLLAKNLSLLPHRIARWCNGSTADSGSVCHGSNPCRAAKFSFFCDRSWAAIDEIPWLALFPLSHVCGHLINTVIKIGGMFGLKFSLLSINGVFHH